MKKLSELFHICAYDIEYINVKDWVSYAFKEEKDHLYIFYQGSAQNKDWFSNFFFIPVRKKPYKDMVISYRVHSGFLYAWKQIEDIIIAKITERKLREPTEKERAEGSERVLDYAWKHITVVGYSHGGALTFFTTECIWYWRSDLRKDGFESYAFESPRVLSEWFIPKTIKERWKNMIVIRTNNDLVTHCPPWLFRFVHTGTMLKIKGDTSLVENKLPKCIKSHFPQVVYDALLKYEK